VRRLVVNADDFGLSSGVNRAVAEAHDRGLLTSATLMANGLAAPEAMQIAIRRPGLSVGCHVQLVDGTPLSPPQEIATLVDPVGNFSESFGSFAFAALRGKIDPEQVELEATAQMRKLAAGGIKLSHFDTHKHVHIFPSVLRPMLRAAQKCGIGAVRNPFTPAAALASGPYLLRPGLWTRYFGVRILGALSGTFKQAVANAGLVTTDGTLGIVTTGALDEHLWAAIARSIPQGTWEFVCHPGYNDADLARIRTRLRESRAQELRILTSAAARDVLKQNQVDVISYRDLAR
jgi:chitin disaccharide deacetylase